MLTSHVFIHFDILMDEMHRIQSLSLSIFFYLSTPTPEAVSESADRSGSDQLCSADLRQTGALGGRRHLPGADGSAWQGGHATLATHSQITHTGRMGVLS